MADQITRSDELVNRIKNNRIMSIIIFVGLIIIGLGTFTDSIKLLMSLALPGNNEIDSSLRDETFAIRPLDRWEKNEIVLGAKSFIESNILLAMMALVIETDTDIRVQRQYNSSDSNIWNLVNEGKVDVYVEYSGTILAKILRLPDAQVRNIRLHLQPGINELLQENSITKDFEFLDRFGFNNGYVLVMLKSKAREIGILNQSASVSISDLANVAMSAKLSFKAHPDFYTRSDCMPGLSKEYRLIFHDNDYIKHSNIYTALDKGEVDVVPGYHTDSQLIDSKYIQIVDDKEFFPPYFAAPLSTKRVLVYFPLLRNSLKKLAGKISENEMRSLINKATNENLDKDETNLSASIDAQLKLEEIVRIFLKDKGIL